jgi:GNAT superfamily N-acetyltransferase
LASAVPELRILAVDGAAADNVLEDWRQVHNTVVPAAAMSLEEVRERVTRNLLDVAYVGDTLVGCCTVRPPAGPGGTATVIARVLPGFRRRGFGTRLYVATLDKAAALGAGTVETIVWEANVDGLRFAYRRGFVEASRDLLPGEDIAYVTLRLVPDPG